MARTHGRIYTSIWIDDDFRKLRKDAQRAYVLLVSQPQINNCGVLPYVPRKWAKLATDETEDQLVAALGQLIDARFIVLDEETDELLVRTFIRHDRIQAQPNLEKSARRQFGETESKTIRRALLGEYPELFDDVATEDLREALPEPLWKDLSEETPSATPSESPSRARDRTRTAPAPSPTPAPSPQQQDQEDLGLETDNTESAAAETSQVEAPRSSRIAEVLDEFAPGDPDSINHVEPLAVQLDAPTFEQLVEKTRSRKQVRNKAGFLVDSMRNELRKRQRVPIPRDNNLVVTSPIEKLKREQPDRYLEAMAGALDEPAVEAYLTAYVTDEDKRIELRDRWHDARSAAA